jgi:DNA replication protein DnaC
MAKRLDEALNGTPVPERGRPQPPGGGVPVEKSTDPCSICGGVGFLRADVPYGDPFFGLLLPCECRERQAREHDFSNLQRFSNLTPFSGKSFENFDNQVHGVSEAYEAARKYARDPQGWLVLTGGYGCGKTHLAAAIANEAVRHHFPSLFTVVPDLLDHLRSTFGPNSEIQYDELFDKVRNTALLVLDDLGTENATPWAEEKLYQIFSFRYNRTMPTVITTNRDINSIDGRIRSRMQDRALAQLVEMKAVDYRAREKGGRRATRSRRV